MRKEYLKHLTMIGEAPGNYSKYDPERHALYPYPPRCAGARLCELMGLPLSEYIFGIDRMNLLDFYPGKQGKGARFPMAAAKESVAALHEQRGLIGRNILLVGRRVAEAFEKKDVPNLTWQHQKAYNFAIIPHPSGINRWWNDAENRAAGEAFLRSVGEQVLSGALSFNDPTPA